MLILAGTSGIGYQIAPIHWGQNKLHAVPPEDRRMQKAATLLVLSGRPGVPDQIVCVPLGRLTRSLA